MPSIVLRHEGTIAVLTINNPTRKNALSQAMWRRLVELLANLASNPDVRTLVVEGGGSAFCSGADISEFETVYATPDSARAANAQISAGLRAIDNLPFPTIAAVRGPCMGGGCALALACDLLIADTTARFGINPTALGTAYSFRDCQRLAHRIGVGRAKEMLLGARMVDATTAVGWGLVSEVVEPDVLGERVATLAQEVSARSPDALRRVKAMLNAIDQGATDNTDTLQALFDASFESADFTEGTQAFLAKRKPDF